MNLVINFFCNQNYPRLRILVVWCKSTLVVGILQHLQGEKSNEI